MTTYLLIACNLQSKFSLQNHKFRFWLAALLGCILFTQTGIFAQRTIACQDFPTQQQDVNPQWKLMSNWIRTHTPEDSLIISYPWKLANFIWITERATIVKLKMFPQAPQSIVEYYERLNNLSAGALDNIYFGDEELDRRKTVKAISTGFSHLTTAQVKRLMNKYQSDYFLTDESPNLDLPIVHTQTPYVLYGLPND